MAGGSIGGRTTPSVSTMQAGDTGDAQSCWTGDIDENGSDEECCAVEDDETGVSVGWCAPIDVDCGDGAADETAFIVVVDSSGAGAFGFAGDDVCGSGTQLLGCEFDESGELTACGACTVAGEGIVCEELAEEEEDEPAAEGCASDEECAEGCFCSEDGQCYDQSTEEAC
jgi:hypothetical protein